MGRPVRPRVRSKKAWGIDAAALSDRSNGAKRSRGTKKSSRSDKSNPIAATDAAVRDAAGAAAVGPGGSAAASAGTTPTAATPSSIRNRSIVIQALHAKTPVAARPRHGTAHTPKHTGSTSNNRVQRHRTRSRSPKPMTTEQKESGWDTSWDPGDAQQRQRDEDKRIAAMRRADVLEARERKRREARGEPEPPPDPYLAQLRNRVRHRLQQKTSEAARRKQRKAQAQQQTRAEREQRWQRSKKAAQRRREGLTVKPKKGSQKRRSGSGSNGRPAPDAATSKPGTTRVFRSRWDDVGVEVPIEVPADAAGSAAPSPQKEKRPAKRGSLSERLASQREAEAEGGEPQGQQQEQELDEDDAASWSSGEVPAQGDTNEAWAAATAAAAASADPPPGVHPAVHGLVRDLLEREVSRAAVRERSLTQAAAADAQGRAVRFAASEQVAARPNALLSSVADDVEQLRAQLVPLLTGAEQALRGSHRVKGDALLNLLAHHQGHTIANNAEELTEMVLEDLLGDTVDVLNQLEHEKRAAARVGNEAVLYREANRLMDEMAVHRQLLAAKYNTSPARKPQAHAEAHLMDSSSGVADVGAEATLSSMRYARSEQASLGSGWPFNPALEQEDDTLVRLRVLDDVTGRGAQRISNPAASRADSAAASTMEFARATARTTAQWAPPTAAEGPDLVSRATAEALAAAPRGNGDDGRRPPVVLDVSPAYVDAIYANRQHFVDYEDSARGGDVHTAAAYVMISPLS